MDAKDLISTCSLNVHSKIYMLMLLLRIYKESVYVDCTGRKEALGLGKKGNPGYEQVG